MSVTEALIESFKLKLSLRDAVEGDDGATTEGSIRKGRASVLRGSDRQKKLLGYMAISEAKTYGLKDALWVDDLAVVPEAYGKSIGAAFFMRIASNWHSEKYNEIHLLVRHEASQQKYALQLYKALGFSVESDPDKQHYEKRDDQQYMVGKRTEVMDNARRLLKARPLGEGINMRFAYDKRWMRRNAPLVWKAIKMLYVSVHGAADGDEAKIEEVLQDGSNKEPASMFLVAMGEL